MSKFLDPDGRKYGIPTWPWRMAPQHLRTRRQLAEKNQRPVDGEPQAQVMRARRGRAPLVAHLYDAETAVSKRVPTTAQLEALQLARWTRSMQACERRGLDATDLKDVIEQARRDIAARRTKPPQGRERNR